MSRFFYDFLHYIEFSKKSRLTLELNVYWRLSSFLHSHQSDFYGKTKTCYAAFSYSYRNKIPYYGLVIENSLWKIGVFKIVRSKCLRLDSYYPNIMHRTTFRNMHLAVCILQFHTDIQQKFSVQLSIWWKLWLKEKVIKE